MFHPWLFVNKKNEMDKKLIRKIIFNIIFIIFILVLFFVVSKGLAIIFSLIYLFITIKLDLIILPIIALVFIFSVILLAGTDQKNLIENLSLGIFSFLVVAVESPCFNNNQGVVQKRLLWHRHMLYIATGCILILQAANHQHKKNPPIFDLL